MSETLTTRDGLVGNSPRYTGAISPPYQRYLKDDSGAAIDLTGVPVENLGIIFVDQRDPTQVNLGSGTFTIPSDTATQGLISYQYGVADLTVPSVWLLFVTCQLLDEPAPRVFDPDILSVDSISLSSSGDPPTVTIQSVNLTEVNGAPISDDNPVPVSLTTSLPSGVTIANGADTAQGSTTDASTANTTIGLLKAIKAAIQGTLTVSGSITATNPSVGTNGAAIPTSATEIGASDGANLQPLQVESSSNKNLRTSLYNGANEASVSAGGALKVDNSGVTQPISGTVSVNALPASSNTIGGVELVDGAGANKATISAGGAVKVDGSAATQPISAASLPLPSGASTSAKQPALGTAGTPSSDVLTVQGATSMTALKTDGSGVTQPVSGTVTVQQSTAGNLKVDLSGTAANATAIKVDGSATTQPVSGTVTANAGSGTFTVSDQHSNITADYDTGAGTQTMTMFGVALPASGGSVAGGTSSNPLRTDPTGTTTQPISAASLPLPTGAAQESGNLATLAGAVSSAKVQTNVSQVNGVAPSMGNGVSGTGVQRVTIASDSTGQVTLAAGSAVIGHVIADSGSTTAVTQATASNLNAQVVGPAASGASNAGNPVKIGGPFNTTQPTVTNGQAVDAQMTARGAQIVAPGVDGFSVTANAGTNLNTSALALESGGNLATLAGAVTSAKVQANVAQINGVAPTMGNGVSGTGVQRVTIASDSTGQVALAAGSAVVGGVELVDSAGTNKASISAGGAIKVDNSAVTQPISAASLPLPSGAATSAKQPALGTAGSASTDVLTVQGIASMTALKVDGSAVTQPANVTQFGGTNVSTGTGASGSGIPRVTVSNDSELQLWDGTNGPVAAKAANTPPTLTDKALMTALSPNNTGLPVNIPKIVQSTNNKSSGSVASLVKAFTSNNAQGNSIVVVCAVGNGTAPTISDTASNTYSQAGQIPNGTAFNVAIFFATNIASGANTVTVNNGGSTASIAMEIYEISGFIAQVTAQPSITASATGSSGTAATSVISALSPNEYAFAGIGVGTATQTITAGSGWTNDSGQQNPTTPAGLFSFVSMSQYLGSLAAVTPQATFTSEPWAIVVATFRPVVLGVEGTTKEAAASNATLASVAASASSVTLFAANSAARGRMLMNDSASSLYLAYAATATTSAYSVLIPPNTLWEMPKPGYTGVISGIWGSATGNARLTEVS